MDSAGRQRRLDAHSLHRHREPGHRDHPPVNVPATDLDVAALTVGTPYTFTVVATNGTGDSDPSMPSAAVTPYDLPGAPTNVTAAPGNQKAVVSWSAPSSDGFTPITQYSITSTPPTTTLQAAGTDTQAMVTGLTNGTSYTFSITATNAAGTGPAATSNAVSPAGVPDAPMHVVAVPVTPRRP